MYRVYVALLIPLLLTIAPLVAAQDPLPATDHASLLRAGHEAGMQDGRRASVALAAMGSAAATLVATPYIGGVGSLIAGMALPGKPSQVPQIVPEAAHPAYQQAYRDGYQQVYRPRLRSAVITSALLTSVVWLGVVLGMAG